MTQISSIAVAGLQKAAQSIASSAEEIGAGNDVGNPEPIVNLIQAENSFKANTKVLEVDKKLGDYLLDILA